MVVPSGVFGGVISRLGMEVPRCEFARDMPQPGVTGRTSASTATPHLQSFAQATLDRRRMHEFRVATTKGLTWREVSLSLFPLIVLGFRPCAVRKRPAMRTWAR